MVYGSLATSSASSSVKLVRNLSSCACSIRWRRAKRSPVWSFISSANASSDVSLRSLRSDTLVRTSNGSSSTSRTIEASFGASEEIGRMRRAMAASTASARRPRAAGNLAATQSRC